ncbi:MAG TPA: bifunctional phosphoglucose/phosphomannose isomerase [Chitinophagales bacterium]|nr:bifunctional phosphoglucose/phosphomannose isomerase [Chitinophagales bacterium]
MDKYIQRFPEQLTEALQIVEQANLPAWPRKPLSVVITGMGGSGIGAVIVRSLIGKSLRIPFLVVNNYNIPVWCNADTLVICSSYSGNTEETIAAYQDAVAKGCMTACVTTGGKLLAFAQQTSMPTIKIPGGMPPRSCVGYSIVGQLALLAHAGIIEDNWKQHISGVAQFLQESGADIRSQAKQLASLLQPFIPIIYSDQLMSGVAVRWKQQLNENAKVHAFDHTIPEMNHNELVAYVEPDQRFCPIFLRHSFEHARIQERFAYTMELMDDKTGSLCEVEATGEGIWQQIFSLLHFGDWLSVELAAIRGVDPIDIAILEQLKSALGKA